MSKDAKNPHDPDSPEWQLFENYRSQKQLINTFTHDIERYERLRAAAFAKRDAYAAALQKLGAKLD